MSPRGRFTDGAGTLIQDVHSFSWRAPLKPTSEAQEQRLDPEELLTGCRVLLRGQWFYPYSWCGLVEFEAEQERFIYLPPRRAALRSGSEGTIDRLPAYRSSAPERWLGAVQRRFETNAEFWYSPLNAHNASSEDTRPPAADLDLAVTLRADVLRIAQRGQPAHVSQLLGLLDLLACFRGAPRANARLPDVHVDQAAARLLRDRMGDAGGPVLDSAASDVAGTRRYVAIADRREESDMNVGGYTAEMALVKLTVRLADGAWSFERRVLWSEEREGEPKS